MYLMTTPLFYLCMAIKIKQPILHSKILLDSLDKYNIESELIVIEGAGHGPSFKIKNFKYR